MWNVVFQGSILAQLWLSLQQGQLDHTYMYVYTHGVRNMTLTVDLAHADGQLPTGCDAPCNPYANMLVVRITQRDDSGPEVSSVLLTYRSLSTTSLTKVTAL
jgi:hypothetical protein